MGTLGLVLLIAGAIVIGRAIHKVDTYLTGHRSPGSAVMITAVAAVAGGFLASELLGQAGEWGYEYDGLYVFSAALGAALVGLVAAIASRFAETRSASRA